VWVLSRRFRAPHRYADWPRRFDTLNGANAAAITTVIKQNGITQSVKK
jgi:hypothetical protein